MNLGRSQVRRIRTAMIAAALASLTLAACAPMLIRPSEREALWAATHYPGTTLRELEAGRAVYVSRCAGCHNLHLPGEFPPERWATLVGDMAKDVHLDDAERDLVLRFLASASATARGDLGTASVTEAPGAAAGARSAAARN